MLLDETIDLLKEVKKENISKEDSNYKSLTKAILNLEKLRDQSHSPDRSKQILSILGKFLDNIPEIQELLKMLAEL